MWYLRSLDQICTVYEFIYMCTCERNVYVMMMMMMMRKKKKKRRGGDLSTNLR